MIKRFLGIIIFGLLFSGNANADKSLINIIDTYWKRSADIKMNKVQASAHLFLQEELKIATDKIGKVGRPCYREVLKNKSNYNSNIDCLKFRVLLGNDADEWKVNLNKLKSIFAATLYVKDNKKWIEKWDDDKFDKFVKLGKEIVQNVAIGSELLSLASDK